MLDRRSKILMMDWRSTMPDRLVNLASFAPGERTTMLEVSAKTPAGRMRARRRLRMMRTLLI